MAQVSSQRQPATGKESEANAPASLRFKDLQEAIRRLEKLRLPEWKIVKVLRSRGDHEYVLRRWWVVSCRHAGCTAHARCHFSCVQNVYAKTDLDLGLTD